MDILCLDLEGVLVPEVWQAVARETQLPELLKTTRDIPVYEDLMDYRLDILHKQGITLTDIQNEIAKLKPLDGAKDFLDWASERFQVAIISDTFYEFAGPLMVQLGDPFLLCHKLVVENDRVVGYKLRQTDPKRHSVKAFKSLDLKVIAAGDSFNDVSMLEEADHGIFFQAPENVRAQFPQYPLAEDYAQLQALIEEAVG
ncbi:MAG: bifunctional phosphoserine phosphatase/homoserine phosphotransferase ThrH [Gammaproteobacteria bacterium]|nr:bifunctional phosphoserine phosphatase/homoserine phosphotransferase ThrH [Gammaproteobacteria bacterium]MDB9797727.1 bifunctional phosphoserine phosphatase/homoserine phosphotransferase ThrH [Pseudomonadales bacterium]MBT3694536.1 bifunctional phosphoserine phosphatase/homoserine phosphotransferase ThrH [Gammaproteobacteria bacterium]MBT5682716.1 bifunctional phosphoserine phosphatase/homoserine phosphotransferase ThrH [Gammaproteobacteria bacterium]MBT6026057.1 bifunctional phosphoserine p